MTTKTAIRKKVRSTGRVVGVKAIDGEPGTFEAIVSVFGNVDYHGDRIAAGAFEKSLERWAAAGDPIPVIFSHQWDNLDAHIGEVLEAKELAPGDPDLAGTGLEENGGLWTKFALELDEDFASRVAKKLTKRTLREFSFAYDVLDEARGSDGATELLELEILEVGPTLKGANPATVLLSKAFGDDASAEGLLELVRAGAKTVAHSFAPGEEDASRCLLCGMTRNTVAHNATAEDPAGAKASVPVSFEGSVEDELEELYSAGLDYFRGLDSGNGGFYTLHAEATYPAELRAIVLVEGWEDPYGEGIFYEVSFERDEDGELSVSDASELEISVDVRPKARSLKHRAPGRKIDGDTREGKRKGKAEDPDEGKAEDPEARTGPGEEATRLALELAELELL